MTSFKKPILIIIALFALLFAFTWVKNNNIQKAPNISFNDIHGQYHSIAEYADKPVLMIFWATDCPGCVQEMPELNALYKDYADKGLAMIGVAMSHDSPEHINAMRQQRQLNYILTWDESNEIATAFNRVRVTPTHFLIAPNGDIVMRKIGILNFEHLRQKIDDMLLTAT
ncbi:MAG: peroxiredoxin [Methylophagaceae bacterium]|jgi:peroxiredoxin